MEDNENIYYLVFSEEWGIIKAYEYKVNSNRTIETPTVKVDVGPTIEGHFEIMWNDPGDAPLLGSIQMYGKHRGDREWFMIHSLEGVEIHKVEGIKMHFHASDLVWDESINFTN